MKWTKEHTAQVLELYLKERPRAQDKKEQQVRDMAAMLERTPASIQRGQELIIDILSH